MLESTESTLRQGRWLYVGSALCEIVLLCVGIYWLQIPRPLAPTIAATPLPAVRYHVTDLGIAPFIEFDVTQVPYAALAGINRYGQIAGVTRDHAFLWTPHVPHGTTGSLVDFSRLFPPGTLQLTAINEYGQIAGTWQSQQTLNTPPSTGLAQVQAFLWTPAVPNGTSGTILYFPHSSSIGGLNAMGQVLLDNGMLWTPVTPHSTRGAMTILPALIPGPKAYLNEYLNDDGQVVANGSLWTPTTANGTTGTTTTFTTTVTTDHIDLMGLNAYGQVLFEVDTDSSIYLWTPSRRNGLAGRLTQLSGLFGDFRLVPQTLSIDGTVAGTSVGGGFFFLFGSVEHAVVWQPTAANTPTGRLLTLGGVGSDVDSSPAAMNAADLVVGRSCTKAHDVISVAFCATTSHVFLWNGQHGLHDLQPLLAAGTPYTLFDAETIGPQGEIAALGTGSDREPHVLLLVPQYAV